MIRNLGTQRGNIMLGLFGAIGLVATIGVVSMGVVKGPVRGMGVINDRTQTQNAALAAANMIAQASVAQEPAAADCDEDGYIEPIAFRSAAAGSAPVGGGHIPMSVGASKADGWGTPFGYCAWDPGEKNKTQAVAACGGAAANRLNGGGAEEPAGITIAVISAGPDKVFQSSCVNWSGSNPIIVTPSNSDDIVRTVSYAEFMVSGKGDAKLKELPDDACTAQSIGLMRLYMGVVQVCVDTGWEEVGTSAQAEGNFTPVVGAQLNSTHTSNQVTFSGFMNQKTVSVVGGATLLVNGAVRTQPATINSGDRISLRANAAGVPETTLTFTVSVGGVKKSWTIRTRDRYPPSLTISPSSAEPPTVLTSNVQGPANPSYGLPISFVVTNTGEIATNALSPVVISNTTNYQFHTGGGYSGDDCVGKILPPNGTCVIDIRSRATSAHDQTNITTSVTVSDGPRTVSASPVRGFAKGWTCASPWGGPRINSGSSITAYNITAPTSCNGSCTSQSRACSADVLSGSAAYQYQNCSPLQNCTYSWNISGWSGCNASCGGGSQTRSVMCLRSDGTTVPDVECTSRIGAKPPVSQGCNSHSCADPCTYGGLGSVCVDGAVYIGNASGARIYARWHDGPSNQNWATAMNICASYGPGWYLPSQPEAYLFYSYSGSGIKRSPPYGNCPCYWTSTESGAQARFQLTGNHTTGASFFSYKTDVTGTDFRCVRR